MPPMMKYNDVNKVFQATDKTRLLLHPEKTFAKVEQIELGYLMPKMVLYHVKNILKKY